MSFKSIIQIIIILIIIFILGGVYFKYFSPEKANIEEEKTTWSKTTYKIICLINLIQIPLQIDGLQVKHDALKLNNSYLFQKHLDPNQYLNDLD